jgi:hypothetical protein
VCAPFPRGVRTTHSGCSVRHHRDSDELEGWLVGFSAAWSNSAASPPDRSTREWRFAHGGSELSRVPVHERLSHPGGRGLESRWLYGTRRRRFLFRFAAENCYWVFLRGLTETTRARASTTAVSQGQQTRVGTCGPPGHRPGGSVRSHGE